jgi:hypothetical protein
VLLSITFPALLAIPDRLGSTQAAPQGYLDDSLPTRIVSAKEKAEEPMMLRATLTAWGTILLFNQSGFPQEAEKASAKFKDAVSCNEIS